MTAVSDEARRLFEASRVAASARQTDGAIARAREAIEIAPDYPEALEHLAMLLTTRKHRFDEGLVLMERATEIRPDDAGLWYSLGWCAEFAAHESQRRGASDLDPRILYERAAVAFRRCLALNPEDKLLDDATDLLDHVENELRSL